MTDSSRVLLFSYGTLQDAAVQRRQFGRLLVGRPDSMSGYRQELLEIGNPEVVRLSGKTHHPIVSPSPDPQSSVPGMVFEITAAELAAADAYEVSDYVRVLVRLVSGDDAWVYVKAN